MSAATREGICQMHPPLDDWDEAYLRSIATPDETADLEKKGSAKFDPVGDKKGTRDELAKQVCAFSNAGDGFLVYGIAAVGGLDAGVADTVGGQPVKAWVEADIPRLPIQPPVTSCQARLIHCPGHHAVGCGALVVQVPLSDRRPHWVMGNPDLPYLRVGEHSVPMRLQTLLDISSRGSTPVGEILSLGRISGPATGVPVASFLLNPMVRLVSGPLCREWAFELYSPPTIGEFSTTLPGTIVSDGAIYVAGKEPLFPGRSTRVLPNGFQFNFRDVKGAREMELVASLYAGSSRPVQRRFPAQVLYEP